MPLSMLLYFGFYAARERSCPDSVRKKGIVVLIVRSIYQVLEEYSSCKARVLARALTLSWNERNKKNSKTLIIAVMKGFSP
jgi:hypothetical protein